MEQIYNRLILALIIVFCLSLCGGQHIQVCDNVLGQELRPDYNNCSIYHLCTPQKDWILTCNPGQVWNQEMNKCITKGSVNDTCTTNSLLEYKNKILAEKSDLTFASSSQQLRPPLTSPFIDAAMDRWSEKFFCPPNATGRHAHPTRCAQYYDCSKTFAVEWWGQNLRECPYPKVFNEVTKECDSVAVVNCKSRQQPVDPCDYLKNQCRSSHCVPCHIRYATCRGMPNGLHQWRGREISSYFIVCQNERVVFHGRCEGSKPGQNLVFSPKLKSCVSQKDAREAAQSSANLQMIQSLVNSNITTETNTTAEQTGNSQEVSKTTGKGLPTSQEMGTVQQQQQSHPDQILRVPPSLMTDVLASGQNESSSYNVASRLPVLNIFPPVQSFLSDRPFPLKISKRQNNTGSFETQQASQNEKLLHQKYNITKLDVMHPRVLQINPNSFASSTNNQNSPQENSPSLQIYTDAANKTQLQTRDSKLMNSNNSLSQHNIKNLASYVHSYDPVAFVNNSGLKVGLSKPIHPAVFSRSNIQSVSNFVPNDLGFNELATEIPFTKHAEPLQPTLFTQTGRSNLLSAEQNKTKLVDLLLGNKATVNTNNAEKIQNSSASVYTEKGTVSSSPHSKQNTSSLLAMDALKNQKFLSNKHVSHFETMVANMQNGGLGTTSEMLAQQNSMDPSHGLTSKQSSTVGQMQAPNANIAASSLTSGNRKPNILNSEFKINTTLFSTKNDIRANYRGNKIQNFSTPPLLTNALRQGIEGHKYSDIVERLNFLGTSGRGRVSDYYRFLPKQKHVRPAKSNVFTPLDVKSPKGATFSGRF